MRRGGLVGLVVVLALLPAAPLGTLEALDGREVIRRVNARTRGEDSRMRLTMELRDTKRGSFHKSIILERKRFERGYRTAYRILEPAHEHGIGLLLAEDRPAADMWMYFPISDQLVHVASRGLSALASDFSCADLLVAIPLEDYRFEVLGHAPCGRDICLQVEMTPASQALQRELGFARSVGLVRQDIWMIVAADYFAPSGQKIKTFTAREVEQMDGVWTIRRYAMVNHRADHSTEVEVSQVDYAVHLAADDVSEESLRRAPELKDP